MLKHHINYFETPILQGKNNVKNIISCLCDVVYCRTWKVIFWGCSSASRNAAVPVAVVAGDAGVALHGPVVAERSFASEFNVSPVGEQSTFS